MTDNAEYFQYLRGRSVLALLYRKFWLYPRLKRAVRGRVLDVGCGIGDFLASRPGTVGVDVNPMLVDWCRRRGFEARVIENGRLPVEDASFDSVTLDNVLEHVPDPAELLAEIRRVLVPGGTCLIGVPGPRGYRSDPDHKVFYDEAGLTRTLTRAGFRLAHTFHTPVRSAFLNEHMRQYCVYGVFRRAGDDS